MRSTVRLAAALAWLLVIALAMSGAAAPLVTLAPLTELVASLVQALLHPLGIDAARGGVGGGGSLYVPGVFGYEITVGCTGVVAAAALTVAILASPGARAAKAWGLLVGVPLVLAVNLLRLVHLFYIGIHAPGRFALAHSLLWEGAVVLVTFTTWLAWTRWSAPAGETAQ
jgi:exosortase/archaeosortase family protein